MRQRTSNRVQSFARGRPAGTAFLEACRVRRSAAATSRRDAGGFTGEDARTRARRGRLCNEIGMFEPGCVMRGWSAASLHERLSRVQKRDGRSSYAPALEQGRRCRRPPGTAGRSDRQGSQETRRNLVLRKQRNRVGREPYARKRFWPPAAGMAGRREIADATAASQAAETSHDSRCHPLLPAATTEDPAANGTPFLKPRPELLRRAGLKALRKGCR